jgi:hypothetical protein
MNRPDRTTSSFRLVRSLLFVACSTVLVACATATGSPSPRATSSVDPTPVNTNGVVLDGVPTACNGLGEEDCHRVSAHVATLLTAGDPPVQYVQIGPFRCPGEQRCPRTLAARPEGEVILEFPAEAAAFHVRVRGGIFAAQRQGVFGIDLPPSSKPPVQAGPHPFTLGHCGLWSGVDLGGSWWDPAGFVDFDHGDGINAAEGTIVVLDPDHAVFTSNAGLTVELIRRSGQKFLPLCD